jgi:FeS assembly SUF system protein
MIPQNRARGNVQGAVGRGRIDESAAYPPDESTRQWAQQNLVSIDLGGRMIRWRSAASGCPGVEGSAPRSGERIVQKLETVYDPEIPTDIYELGLIYKVSVEEGGAATIRMTLTTPMCPAAQELPPEVESKTRAVAGVTSVQLGLVWDPPWTPDMMSEAARLELGMV